MATLERLEKAFRAAHEAGNTEHAQRFANEIRRMRRESSQQAGQSIASNIQQPTQTQPVDFDFSKMAANLPSSYNKMASGAMDMITHPLDTNQAIGNLIAGGVQKLIPGEQEKEVYANAVIDSLRNDYGSLDSYNQTLMDDPLGALSDITGAMSLPLGLGVGSARGLSRALKNAPENRLQAALNLPTTVSKADKRKIADTMLSEDIRFSDKGATKAAELPGKIDQTLDSIIQKAMEEGAATIPKERLNKYIPDIKEELGGANVAGKANLRQIDRVVNDVDTHLWEQDLDNLTLEDVQKLKKSAYQQVNYDKSSLPTRVGRDKAHKAIGRAAKEELEVIGPEVAALNRRSGNIADVNKYLPKSLARAEGKSPLTGAVPVLSHLGGYSVAGPLGSIGTLALGGWKSPSLQARLAFLLRGARRGANWAGTPSNFHVLPEMLRQSAIQSERLNQEAR